MSSIEHRKPLHHSVPPVLRPKRANGTYMEGEWVKIIDGQIKGRDISQVKACGYCFLCNRETYIPKFKPALQGKLHCMHCVTDYMASYKLATSVWGKESVGGLTRKGVAWRHPGVVLSVDWAFC